MPGDYLAVSDQLSAISENLKNHLPVPKKVVAEC